MDVNTFFEKQARYILSLNPVKDDLINWHSDWDKCKGIEDGEFYYVEYSQAGEIVRRMKFTKEQGRQIKIKNNLWLYNPILNRSGLAAQIWNDDIPNKLRRRLEQKGMRNTFSEEEKKRIRKEIKEFLNEVVKAL